MSPVLTRATRVIAAAASAVALILAAGCGGGADAIGVNALAADPMAFSGTVTVKGVVQNVDAAGQFVVIIDEDEYATCGLYPCAGAGIVPLHVPVDGSPSSAGTVYSGSMPNIEDFVVVVGEVKSLPQGLVFDVHRMERGGATLLARQ